MQTRTCGECVNWEGEFEGTKIGCLHLGKEARRGGDCPADAPACEHFEDRNDPANRACATCGNKDMVRLTYSCIAPESWKDRRPVRCPHWVALPRPVPSTRQEACHA